MDFPKDFLLLETLQKNVAGGRISKFLFEKKIFYSPYFDCL